MPATRRSGPGCACSRTHQQIREPEALGGWLKTTARRECLRILAEQRRIDPLPEGTEYPDTAVDVERSVLDPDQARHLRGLLTTLPARSFALINSPVPGRPARVRPALGQHRHPGGQHRADARAGAAQAAAAGRGGLRVRRLSRCSTALACTRLCTPILVKIRATCTPTVFSLM